MQEGRQQSDMQRGGQTGMQTYTISKLIRAYPYEAPQSRNKNLDTERSL